MRTTDFIQERASSDRAAFEKEYAALRIKEHRLYNDEEVSLLPVISATHPHYKEWMMRNESCQRLIRFLNQKKEEQNILEVGCGNGWLSAKIAAATKGRVTGIDIHQQEIEQAKRVFRHIPNLYFLYSDILDKRLKQRSFHVIIFAASIQYFFPLNETIDQTLRLLRPGGEIHIIDSHFYSINEKEEAKQRSLGHFLKLGSPAMAKHYYHHAFDDIRQYHYKLLYNPAALVNKITGRKNPFPHICIIKNNDRA